MSLINRLIDSNDYNGSNTWLDGDEGFLICTITPKETGLDLYLSLDDTGGNGRSDNTPRIYVYESPRNEYKCEAIITIEPKPKIIIEKNVKSNDRKKIKKAMDYVGKNYDMFLKHYNGSFENIDLFNALKEKRELK